MLKVKRRFNTIYWTDLRSCWKRDKPCGDSDRRSDSHPHNTVSQLASYASFEPVVAGDAHKRLIGRVNLHPSQNPHPAFMRNLPLRGIASSHSARCQAPGCNLWWYRVVEKTRCPLEPSDLSNLRQNLQVPVEVCLDRFPVVLSWPHEGSVL